MTTTMSVQIPRLPANTAGRWLDVIREDVDMVRRWLNVMYQMDRRYFQEGPDAFGYSMGHRPSPLGASYYYWSSICELAMRLVYIPARRQHMLMSVGFLGSISPDQALDMLVEKAMQYLRERSATSVFAIVPKHMDNSQLLTLYSLVRKHPRVRVVIEADAERAQRWNIDAIELTKP